jgi:uncharacterized membrane protein
LIFHVVIGPSGISLGMVMKYMIVGGCTFSFLSKEKVPKRKVATTVTRYNVLCFCNACVPARYTMSQLVGVVGFGVVNNPDFS